MAKFLPPDEEDTMTVQCDECDGAGEWCHDCENHPENCTCETDGENWTECEACQGTGLVESDECEDDE